MNAQRLLDAVRRSWLLVVLSALVFLGIAVALTALPAPQYGATARGFVSVSAPEKRSPNVLTSGSQYIQARMTSYAQLGTSNPVVEPVISSLKLSESPQALRRRLSASAVVETAFIEIEVTDPDPAQAMVIADALVIQLGRTIEDLENGTVRVALSDPATPPARPSNRQFIRTGAVAAAGGLVVGMGLAVLVSSVRVRRRGSAVGPSASAGD